MSELEWRGIDRQELARLLTGSRLVDSQAVGATTVYRLDNDGREVLALALPDGQALVVERAAPPAAKRRRRVDGGVNPASR